MRPKALLLPLSALILLVGCHHKQVATRTATPTAASAPAMAGIDDRTYSLSVAHLGPAKLYPNASLTPGKADTLDASDLTSMWTDSCPSGKKECTYSQSHRYVPESVHTAVYNEYHVTSDDRNIQEGEVDHLVPLCAGGSNDISNLWYQPADNKWKGKNYGYHEKDHLEKYICDEIKAGTLDPKVAYRKIRSDWVAYYREAGLDKAEQGVDEEID